MRKLFVAIVALGIWAPTLFGQEPTPRNTPTWKLRITDSYPLFQPAVTSIFDKVGCDAERNLYVRFAAQDELATPITQITERGENKVVFEPRLQGWDRVELYDFAVSPEGAVQALGARGRGTGPNRTVETGVFVFKEDGQFDFFFKTEDGFSAEHVAAFPDGDFLVSGWRRAAVSPQDTSGRGERRTAEAYAVIYDRRGKVVKSLRMTPEGASFPLSALSRGSTVGGSDGNIYALIRAGKPKIYVINSSGEVVRSLDIEPPTAKSSPLEVRWAGENRLLLQFAEEGPRKGSFAMSQSIFAEVDATTGETLAQFHTNPEIGGVLGCYADGRFVFLGTDSAGRSVLLHVRAE